MKTTIVDLKKLEPFQREGKKILSDIQIMERINLWLDSEMNIDLLAMFPFVKHISESAVNRFVLLLIYYMPLIADDKETAIKAILRLCKYKEVKDVIGFRID